MGIYAEPNIDKEVWLLTNKIGGVISRFEDAPEGTLPVVMLAPFKGLGIATSKKEFARLRTGAVLGIFAVPIEKLAEVTPGGMKVLK